MISKRWFRFRFRFRSGKQTSNEASVNLVEDTKRSAFHDAVEDTWTNNLENATTTIRNLQTRWSIGNHAISPSMCATKPNKWIWKGKDKSTMETLKPTTTAINHSHHLVMELETITSPLMSKNFVSEPLNLSKTLKPEPKTC